MHVRILAGMKEHDWDASWKPRPNHSLALLPPCRTCSSIAQTAGNCGYTFCVPLAATQAARPFCVTKKLIYLGRTNETEIASAHWRDIDIILYCVCECVAYIYIYRNYIPGIDTQIFNLLVFNRSSYRYSNITHTLTHTRLLWVQEFKSSRVALHYTVDRNYLFTST